MIAYAVEYIRWLGTRVTLCVRSAFPFCYNNTIIVQIAQSVERHAYNVNVQSSSLCLGKQ